MERFSTFLPSMLVLLGIAAVVRLYTYLVIKRWGNLIESVEWRKKNTFKAYLLVGLPVVCLYAPALEEVIFRAPLLILFNGLSPAAWYGIVIASVIFSVCHWFGQKFTLTDVMEDKKEGELPTGPVTEEIRELAKKEPKRALRRKIYHVIGTFPAGIFLGYFAIKSQSLWVAAGLHSLWNLAVPITSLFLMLIWALAVVVFHFLKRLLGFGKKKRLRIF